MKESSSKDFLSVILNKREAEEATKNVFTPDYVSAVMFEHFLAGSSTMAFTLSSVIYLVAEHPGVEKKLLEETDGFSPRDRLLTAQDLQENFPYLYQARTRNLPLVVTVWPCFRIRRFKCSMFCASSSSSHLQHLLVWLQVIKEAMRFTCLRLYLQEKHREQ